MQTKTASPLSLYLCFLGVTLLALVLARAAFWVFIAPSLADPFGADCLRAFYIGFRFDARLAALVTLPVAAIASIPPLARGLHRHSRLFAGCYFAVFFLLAVAYAVDFGFYAYLGVRLNSVLFELLQDLSEARDMVLQSYPVLAITLGVLAASLLCAFVFYRLARIPLAPSPSRTRRTVGWLFGFVVFALAVYGQISTNFFPLRWSHAYFSTKGPVIALGLNPVQNLYDTYSLSASGSYSMAEAKAAYPFMERYLGVDKPSPANASVLNYDRTLPGRAQERPNIVVIIMESLAFPKTSLAPGNADPTPELKKLRQNSLYFSRFFANSRTTARAVFATMTGIPDVNEPGTGSRNPFVADQRIVANEFTGYRKYYMIGGNTSWANIRAVLSHNIDDLHILEEGTWKADNVDVWGISDYDLFREANETLAGLDGAQPFLAVIQTAGFHKPYTVPPTPGFKALPLSPETQKNYGFESEDEYNSLRYSDFSLGEFLRLARQAPYYENTVFFIFGDHGLNDKTGNMTAGYEACGVAPWHVPMFIHAAPALAARLGIPLGTASGMPCGQVDIFPTAAGLAGIPYTNRTLGRDLFDHRFDDERLVLISGKSSDGIRLIQGDYCYSDMLGAHLLTRLSDPKGEDLSTSIPDRFKEMQQIMDDMNETAKYMLFNNKRTGPSPR